jgi:5'-nucleotidase
VKSEASRILLTNDDGVDAIGLAALARALTPHYNVTVVAPAKEQSGIGHAFTFRLPIYYRRSPEWNGVPAFAVDGTPSDCVKFALSYLLPESPAAVISGMNVGENSGISSIYSGTVAAAREGALWRIPSFAVSMAGTDSAYLDGYARSAQRIIDWTLNAGGGEVVRSSPGTFYNINFPACAPEQCRGVRLTRQSLAFYDDRYRSIGNDHIGEGFVLFGEKRDLEPSPDYDSRALLHNYAALTPMCLDATDHGSLEALKTHETPPPARPAAEQHTVDESKPRPETQS